MVRIIHQSSPKTPLKEMEYPDLWTLQIKPLNTYIKIYIYYMNNNYKQDNKVTIANEGVFQ